MANAINKLSDRRVKTLTKPGRHSDGGGLYLVVDPGGAKRWAFLYRQNGRLREMGLGGLNSIPLATARELAADCRKTIAVGGDPIAERRKREEAQRREAAKTTTFGDFADKYIKDHEAEWGNTKHRAQWRMTLDVYARPLRDKPVAEITTDDVLAVLKPIWREKPETASRLRGRIEQILDAAKAKKLRMGDNPAEWKGGLKHDLPKPDRSSRGHHAALPYKSVPTFIQRLRDQPGLAPLALEFCIQTASRSGEVLGVRWSEIDIDEAVWTVPASRMKGKRDHRVPLSDRAMDILADVAKLKTGEFVFSGRKPNAPLSNMAFAQVLRRMGVEATAHGFRASFRTWAAEETRFAREVAELALAHKVGDGTERAYARGDGFKKRRALADAWARYCCSGATASNVVTLRSV
jgi:integrase